jgi:glutamate-ammonia-ligase adenylyltransferase
VRATTAALSDVADTVLGEIVARVEPAVASKFGKPRCPFALVGLGKLGGREISYHSDLDLLLVYAEDGTTEKGEAHQLYFTELAQRAIRTASAMGPMGRLYAVDMRLRPTGKSGSLVLPLSEFNRYFAGPACQLWERMALTRARVVCGEPEFALAARDALRAAALGREWCPAVVEEARAMRAKLEATAPPRSLKRAAGGLVDVEFAVQVLQLKHGRERPEVMEPNVWAALDALAAAGALPAEHAAPLREGYTFLRAVEARLRIVTDRPLTELPDASDDLAKLARRLGYGDPAAFKAAFSDTTARVRAAHLATLAGA